MQIFYNTEKLLKLLPDYHLETVDTYDEGEYGLPSKPDRKWYITSKLSSQIVKIEAYFDFGTSLNVFFADGRRVSIYSNNLNYDDESLLRIKTNDLISPHVSCIAEEIVDNKDFKEWLLNHSLTQEDLDSVSRKEKVYQSVIYEGVPDVEYSSGIPGLLGPSWAFCSRPLVLDEREIESVLKSIDDIVLRKKIECILYARVFHKS